MKGFLFLFILALLPSVSNAETCERADRNACADLLGADVTLSRVNEETFEEKCGPLADACAVVSITNKTCIIYHKTRVIDKYVLEHEMNHCRGWFHKGYNKRAHRNPWVDYKTYLGG